jgi:hypothetical protein
VEQRRKGETHARARSPRLAERGVARRWARAYDVRVNSPPKSGPKPRRSTLYTNVRVSPCLIHFDRDRPSRLRDAVTPRHLPYIYTCSCHRNSNIPTATKTPSHLGSSTCICDQESRSPEPSSLAILHRERANKVFGKRSLRLLAHFIKFFTTARLPLRRSHAEGRRLQRELRQADRRLHPIVIIKEPQVTYGSCSQIMSYIFNMLICVGMILLDNPL